MLASSPPLVVEGQVHTLIDPASGKKLFTADTYSAVNNQMKHHVEHIQFPENIEMYYKRFLHVRGKDTCVAALLDHVDTLPASCGFSLVILLIHVCLLYMQNFLTKWIQCGRRQYTGSRYNLEEVLPKPLSQVHNEGTA